METTISKQVEDLEAQWRVREGRWRYKLGRLRLGVEPLGEQLVRYRRVTWALTAVPSLLALMFLTLFGVFGRDLALIVEHDPQLVHANVFRQIKVRGRTIQLVNHPNRYDDGAPELRVLALEIGEHTREILSELGYVDSEVERLLSSAAVVASRDVGETSERKAS